MLVWWSIGGTTVRAIGWTPGWTEHPATGGRVGSAAEYAQARELGDGIESPETARTAIRAWAMIAAAQPDDPEAWIELGSLHLLEGDAFRPRAKDRLKCYIAGLQACERAMATNPDFLRRIRQGQTVWDAAAARADLSAVAGRALDELGGNRSWNRYFQAEALRMLAE